MNLLSKLTQNANDKMTLVNVIFFHRNKTENDAKLLDVSFDIDKILAPSLYFDLLFRDKFEHIPALFPFFQWSDSLSRYR